jgi:hypothetical protein
MHDEAQHVPKLFQVSRSGSMKNGEPGQFILIEGISPSLKRGWKEISS